MVVGAQEQEQARSCRDEILQHDMGWEGCIPTFSSLVLTCPPSELADTSCIILEGSRVADRGQHLKCCDLLGVRRSAAYAAVTVACFYAARRRTDLQPPFSTSILRDAERTLTLDLQGRRWFVGGVGGRGGCSGVALPASMLSTSGGGAFWAGSWVSRSS